MSTEPQANEHSPYLTTSSGTDSLCNEATTVSSMGENLALEVRPVPTSLSDVPLARFCEQRVFPCVRITKDYIPYLREARDRFTKPGRRVPVEGQPSWTEWVENGTGYSIRTIQLWLQEKQSDGKKPSEKISSGSLGGNSANSAEGRADTVTDAVTPNSAASTAETEVQMGTVNPSELEEKKREQEISPTRVTLAFTRAELELFERYVTALFTPFRSAISNPENGQIVKSQIVLEALRREFESCRQVAA